MKTGKYFFKKLSAEEQILWAQNLKTNRPIFKMFYPNFEHFIQVSFIWKKTPQGKKFWKQISKRKII